MEAGGRCDVWSVSEYFVYGTVSINPPPCIWNIHRRLFQSYSSIPTLWFEYKLGLGLRRETETTTKRLSIVNCYSLVRTIDTGKRTMGPSSVLRALPEFSLLLSDTVSENSYILFLALTTDKCTITSSNPFLHCKLTGQK